MRTASLSLSDFPLNVPTEFTITDERLQEIKEKKIQQWTFLPYSKDYLSNSVCYSWRLNMEAIKKKMQAMKVEKDNLMDRCDACEQVNKLLYLRIYWSVCSGSQGR